MINNRILKEDYEESWKNKIDIYLNSIDIKKYRIDNEDLNHVKYILGSILEEFSSYYIKIIDQYDYANILDFISVDQFKINIYRNQYIECDNVNKYYKSYLTLEIFKDDDKVLYRRFYNCKTNKKSKCNEYILKNL